MKMTTNYKGCKIRTIPALKGLKGVIRVEGPGFVYVTVNEPGYLEHCTKYIDQRI